MTWWNLTEVVECQLNKQKKLKIRVSFVCNGEIQNDFKMTTETDYRHMSINENGEVIGISFIKVYM